MARNYDGKEFDISIPIEEGEPLGAVPNDKLIIIKIQPGTLADGKLKITKIVWKPGGKKLGLGIKHYQNRVLVSRTDSGSLSAMHLTVGDHMVDLNGIPVTDKDVARDILLKALQTKGEASILIERPDTMEAKHWVHNALTFSSSGQPPSIQMNSDVRAILQREKIRLKTVKPPPPKSILRRPKAAKKPEVSINETQHSNIIASDHEGKQLRGVRR